MTGGPYFLPSTSIDFFTSVDFFNARRRKIARLFAVTHRPEFFSRYGFTPGPREAVAEKIERDCASCPKKRKCTLVATIAVVLPEREVLPVLNGATTALSAA